MNDQPGGPAQTESSPLATLPWEDPGRPMAASFFETLKLLVVNPAEAYRRMPISTELFRPIVYGVILAWAGGAVSLFWNLLFQTALDGLVMTDEMPPLVPLAFFRFGMVLVMLVLMPFFILIGLFLWSVILHLFLMLVGGDNHGFGTTIKVVCYANTSHVAQVVPFVGGLIAALWGLVLQVVGLVHAHKASVGQAVAAVLLPFVLCCVCIGVAVLLALLLGLGFWTEW